MSDLINRQDAVDAVEESRRLNHHQDGKKACVHEYEHRHFLKILKDLPSAEPEIIYCKDCKYMTQRYDTDGNAPYWTCSEWDSGTDYDGFCHEAERRTDAHDKSRVD